MIFPLLAPPDSGRRLAIQAIREAKDGMECEVRSPKRSNQANRYYRAVLKQIERDGWVEDRQYSAEIWHEHFRQIFGKIENGPGGAIIRCTHTMSKEEFLEFTREVETFAQTVLKMVLITLDEPNGRTR